MDSVSSAIVGDTPSDDFSFLCARIATIEDAGSGKEDAGSGMNIGDQGDKSQDLKPSVFL
jgi:hypothetical protein